MKYTKAFVTTHIVYRSVSPFDALEGPYSSVCNGLTSLGYEVNTLQVPLTDYAKPIKKGMWKKEKNVAIPSFLGNILPIKYITDFLVVGIAAFFLLRQKSSKKTLFVGVDPLSTLPLVFLKKIFKFKLIFYCVDFNKHRFANPLLQFIYQKADELSSKHADTVWAVCESLVDYKKEQYKVKTQYIPNSNQFDPTLYKRGKNKRTGNKMAWTGSCITPRQFSLLFSVIKRVQQESPKMEFHFVPLGNHDAFEAQCKKHGLKKWKVHKMHSRREWQEFATMCDVGIAVYDDKFGSTEFIEPLKIWDYMLCGLPFLISTEPSISQAVRVSGAAYILQPHNKVPNDGSLKQFLQKENLVKAQKICLKLAKEYDIAVQMKKTLR